MIIIRFFVQKFFSYGKMVFMRFSDDFVILWICMESYGKHFFHSMELYDKPFLSTRICRPKVQTLKTYV